MTRRERFRRPPTDRPAVLIIVENFPVPQDRRVWKESRALTEAGYGVTVIGPRGDGQPWTEIRDGIRIHRFRATSERHGAAGFVYEYASAWVQIAALTTWEFVRHGFSAIQACNPPDFLFTVALPFKALGRPFVFDQHDQSPEMFAERFGRSDGLAHRMLLRLEAWTYRFADRAIVVNQSLAQAATGRNRMPPQFTTIAANGPVLADVARAAPQPELKQGRPFLCCWVGLIGAVDDGVDLALRAIGDVVHDHGRRDCQFVFIGSGELLQEMRALATELDLDAFVTFTGWLDHDRVFAYLATADIGLQPDPKNDRTDQATPVKTLEYMAFGLPVVAFDLFETRRAVGDAAVYAQQNEPRDFAAHISKLLDDAERRADMGRAGRERIEQVLSWEAQKRAYVRVFDELLRPDRVTGAI